LNQQGLDKLGHGLGGKGGSGGYSGSGGGKNNYKEKLPTVNKPGKVT